MKPVDPISPAVHGLVPRWALFERLSAAAAGGVTLVSAPPGSGKTVLLRSWIEDAGLGERVAWVSVERGERDAQRFWQSVIGALSGAVGRDGIVQKLGAAPAFDGESVVGRLLSDLASLEGSCVLVIDDLHELSSADALAQLEFLVARLPPELRIVLATRRDPRLGLHRLRLTGALVELRASDLRFSPQETRELLEAAGVVLSDTGLALLHERTEGWAAGLRLAAIALAGHPEPERFVAEFSGSERTVADYLLAEVLDRQPADVRRLLLRTSVLERVSGPLADYVTEASGSERILLGLEEVNAFVVSLDVARSWFRYHHLFADMLRLELRRTAPDEIRPLHRAAARWYAEHGYVVDAIEHLQAARDWRQAAHLLFDNLTSLGLDGRERRPACCSPPFRPTRWPAMPSWQRCSPASNSNAARSKRRCRISTPPNGTPQRSRKSDAATSTSSSAPNGSRSLAGAATSTPCSTGCSHSRRRQRQTRRVRSRSATTSGRRR